MTLLEICASFEKDIILIRKEKNFWRRKSVRRAIFRNVEVTVEGRFVPFNLYFVCNTAIGSLCDLYVVPLPKKLT